MPSRTGMLMDIAIKTAHRAPMMTVTKAGVTPSHGLAGDICGHKTKRQITVLSFEQWRNSCLDLGMYVHWTARRANLFVEGIRFNENLVGQCLCIGNDVVLEITGETTPCARMDEACPGLQEVLRPDWRGGITCRVLHGGMIRVGDPVSIT